MYTFHIYVIDLHLLYQRRAFYQQGKMPYILTQQTKLFFHENKLIWLVPKNTFFFLYMMNDHWENF